METFDRSKLLSVQEAAIQLGYFPPYVNKLIRDGKIKAIKRGRQYFIEPKEINRYVGVPEPVNAIELI